MRRVLVLLAAVGLIAVVVIGLTQADSGSTGDPRDFDLPKAKTELEAAPRPLNGLYAQANTLISGGQAAFDARMKELVGTPVVVNKWASWCGPCQAEFPIFQDGAVKHGKEVAFLGLNSGDKDAAAKKFLDTRPLPFPSYTDPDSRIAQLREIGAGFPMTFFVDRSGKTVYTHTGPYTSQKQLDEDIDRYLD
jgi:cytochrome c biogenesis protein CcmG/thiol:disulfide interchange protein DsbE